LCDSAFLVHADPVESEGLVARALRGNEFGPNITAAFLEKNNLSWLMRSHQWCGKGFKAMHNNMCFTVFSAANYENIDTNMGAVVHLTLAPQPPPLETEPAEMNASEVEHPGVVSQDSALIVERVGEVEECEDAKQIAIELSTLTVEATPTDPGPLQETIQQVNEDEGEAGVDAGDEVQDQLAPTVTPPNSHCTQGTELQVDGVVEVEGSEVELGNRSTATNVVQPAVPEVTIQQHAGVISAAPAGRLQMRAVQFPAAHYLKPKGGPSANKSE
jgi:hypothetical protein